MRLRSIAFNVTELELNDGIKILFSYSTPVAAFVPGKGYLRTSKTYSTTSTKHANRWLNGAPVQMVEQEVLEKLAG